ncbi:MAG: FAD-binding oxidoreductase [Alphaproteobacteria bacterium]|nr:FAD-binding oxidoreductase [Alphaproteobacteria bacterium]
MSLTTLRATVVGAGIVGAAIAYRLSRAGCRVRLIDRASAPGEGVTAHSFGWIGHTPFALETTRATFRRRAAALAQHRALDRELGGRLGLAPCGALFWTRDPERVERLFRIGAAADAPLRLLSAAETAERAPVLTEPPPLAIDAPEDCALNPIGAAGALVAAACELGAETRFGCPVDAIEIGRAGAAVVRAGGARIESDLAVVAAGADSAALLGDLAPPPLTRSPSVLVRLDVARDGLSPILSGPELEVRAAGPGALIAAESAPAAPTAADLERIGRETLEAARRLLAPLGPMALQSVAVGARPMTPPDAPLVGRLRAAPAVMIAAAHPGVILAPSIAQAIADELAGRENREALGLSLVRY